MLVPRLNKDNRDINRIFLVFLPIMILLLAGVDSGLAVNPIIVDNGDYTFSATWDFNDLTNYTLDNLTTSNGEVFLINSSSYWNQSNAQDFSEGRRNNVVAGDGIVISEDDLTLGYLQNQNFTTSDSWNYMDGSGSKVVSQWSPLEDGRFYSYFPENITIQNIMLQPDALTGCDTYINESDVLSNYEGLDTLKIGKNATEERTLIWFNCSSISDLNVVDAQLQLYFYQSENLSSANISVHRVTNSWAESSVNWQQRFTSNTWGTSGGDFDILALDTVTDLMDNYGWKSWNITSLVDGWINGTYENYGVLFTLSSGNPGTRSFYSSDHTSSFLRPKLNITYYPLDTFNETAYISQEFRLMDLGEYIDSTKADFELGELNNIMTSFKNGGQINLLGGASIKFDALDDVIDWEEDPDTSTSKGSFALSATTFCEGTGSMMVDYDFSSTMQNYGIMKTTGAFWNWSLYTTLDIWMISSGLGEIFELRIEDIYGSFWESNPTPLVGSWAKYSFDLTGFPGDVSAINAIKFQFSDTLLPITTYIDNITLSGGLPYLPEGTFISRVFDGGNIDIWEEIFWEEDRPAGTNLSIQTRTGNTSSPDISWSEWSSPYAAPGGSNITSPAGRYIQYKVYFNTTDENITSSLSDIRFTKSGFLLTFSYSIDTFENANWARIFIELEGVLIWEKIVNSTMSRVIVNIDIEKYLYNVGDKVVAFGLNLNASSNKGVNITVCVDDFQIQDYKGYYISKIFDAGTQMIWEEATWDTDFNANTNITLSTRTSLDNITWSPWSASLAFNKDTITSPAGMYLQYRIDFITQVLGLSPVFKFINITSIRYLFQGMLIFNNDLIVANLTNWGIFSSLQALQGQSITYECSIDSGTSWHLVPIDGDLSFMSTSTNKIRFKAILEAEDSSSTPILFTMGLTYSVNRPPMILGTVPDQNRAEDGGLWSIDLTPYESDYEDSNEKLRWYITGENTSLYTVLGESSPDDIITFIPLPNAYGNDDVQLWLEDSFGAITSQTLWINITPVNDAPEIQGVIPSYTKEEDANNWNIDLSSYEYDLDNTASELHWSVGGWDNTLFDSITLAGKVLSFDLAANAYGNDEMTVTLSDGLLSVSQIIWVNVTSQNDAPQIVGTITDFLKTEDALSWVFDLTNYESDIENGGPSSQLSWSVTGVDSNLLNIVISDNNLTFTPKLDAFGNNEITIVLTDSLGLTDTQTFWVNITPENDGPKILGIIPSFQKNEDDINWNLDLSGYKYDVDNTSLELSWTILGWNILLFDSVNLVDDVLMFDLKQDAFGSNEITLILSDGILNDSQQICVNVTPVNDAPVIAGSIPDIQKEEDSQIWTLDLSTYESDVEDGSPSSSLTWIVSDVDSSLLSINVQDNNLTFDLIPNAYGYDHITIILMDSGGLLDSQIVFIEITPVNDDPIIQSPIPNIVFDEDTSYSMDLLPFAYDIEDSPGQLRWSISGTNSSLYSWQIDIITMVLNIEPQQNAYGVNDVIMMLMDSEGAFATQSLQVVIISVNDAPYISPQVPESLFETLEGDTISIHLTSFENDVEDSHDLLTWDVENVDTSIIRVSVDMIDDELVIIPVVVFSQEDTQSIETQITLVLTDSGGFCSKQNVTVKVIPINNAPALDDLPNLVIKFDKPYTFDLSPYVTDEDTQLNQLILTTSEPIIDTGNGYTEVNGLKLTFHYPESRNGTNMPVLITLSDGQLSDYAIMEVLISDHSPPELVSPIPDVYFDEDSGILGAFDLDDHFIGYDEKGLNYSYFMDYSYHGDEYVYITINNNNSIDFSAIHDWFGIELVTFRAEDDSNAITEYTLKVTVNPVNDPPVVSNLPDLECKFNVTMVLDLEPFITDVDTSLESLTIVTDSMHVNVQGLNLLFLYEEVTQEIVTITVSDGFYQNSDAITVIVSHNNPPSISVIPELVVRGGEVYLFSFLPYVTDDDNDTKDIEVWTDSGYIRTDTADNMLLKIDFPVEMIGDQVYVTVFVSDGVDINSTEMIIYVTNETIPTIIKPLPNLYFEEDTVFSYALNLGKYFQNVIDYHYFGNENIIVSIEENWVKLSASENWSGSEQITFRGIRDNVFVEDTIVVFVRPVNDPPEFLPLPSFEVMVNQVQYLNLADYIFDIDTPIAEMTVNVDSPYVITYNMKLYFQYQFEINEMVILTVIDGNNHVSERLYVNVTRQNNPPTFIQLLSSSHILVGETWSIDLDDYFYDMDGDQLIFACNKEEVIIDPITHVATWTPTNNDDSLGNVTFSASDGLISVDSSPINLEIETNKSKPFFLAEYWWLILFSVFLIAGLIIFGLVRRKEPEDEIDYNIDVEKAVAFLSSNGDNYIVKGETSDDVYKIFSGLVQSGFEGLCITKRKTEDITQQYGLDKAWIIEINLKRSEHKEDIEEGGQMVGALGLGDLERKDDKFVFSSNFNRIIDTIEEFVTSGENKKLVLFDGIEYILMGDEFIMFIFFLSSLKEKLKKMNSCLLIPVNPKTLSEKELNLLEKETEQLWRILNEQPKETNEASEDYSPPQKKTEVEGTS